MHLKVKYHLIKSTNILSQPQFNQNSNQHNHNRTKVRFDYAYHHQKPTYRTYSMSALSQLISTPFWPNFKDRFFGSTTTTITTSSFSTTTKKNQQQQYISDYWHDFDQMLKIGFRLNNNNKNKTKSLLSNSS